MLNVNVRYFISSRMEFITFVKLQAIHISILQLTIVARDICVRQPRSLVRWFQRGLHVSAPLNKTKLGASGKGSLLFPVEPAIVGGSQ